MQYLWLSGLEADMKTLRLYTLTMTAALTLSACGSMGIGFGLGNSGGGVNFGTGISFPLGGLGVRNDPAKSGINLIDVQVVSYFGTAAQGYKPSDSQIDGGFYRRLLGKQGKLWLVQDYYNDSDRKYNEPMLLSVDEAYRFTALPASGTFYTYHENGQIASKRVYENSRLLKSEQWDNSGRAL